MVSQVQKYSTQFDFKSISAPLTLIQINHFDSNSFAPNFTSWLATSFQKQDFKTNQNRLSVIFQLSTDFEIDSADLALILEVSRQQSLVPLGFINTSKLVADYATFVNLALFDAHQFQNQSNQTSGVNLANSIDLDEFDNSDEPDSIQSNDAPIFYQNKPQLINSDIRKNIQLNEITFINGCVYLPVEIKAKYSVYIYGCCFGQVSVNSEVGQIFIQKLRARRIKIGSYYLKSSEYQTNWIDQAVVFYVQNKQIQTRLVHC